MKINETTLPHDYSRGLYEEKSFDLAEEHTDKIADVLFTGVSEALNLLKSKDHPTSFEFYGTDDKFVAGAVCQYFENEDPEKPGNWSLVWTFDESDIPDNAVRFSLKNEQTHSHFRGAAGEKFGIRFKYPEAIISTLTYLLQEIHKWLDQNAEEGKEVTIEQDGIFQARVAVENGEKVFAIEPAGEIKMLIKDDAAIEK